MICPPGAHKVHLGFAQAADIKQLNYKTSKLPVVSNTVIQHIFAGLITDIPPYDTYLIEHAKALYVIPRLRRDNPHSDIVFLMTQGTFFKDRYNYNRTGPVLTAIRKSNCLIDRTITDYILSSYVNHIISVSKLLKELVECRFREPPEISVVNPYISTELYNTLPRVEPMFGSRTVVSIGRERDYKGFDILVDAWPMVREEFPNAELHLIGEDHDIHADVPGVINCGWVEDLPTALGNGSLYVHPARLEGFGVAVVEAMRAGLPAVVTEKTGARSAVEKVNESFIVDCSPDVIADCIIQYFNMRDEEKQTLSKQFRDASAEYSRENKTAEFCEAIQNT